MANFEGQELGTLKLSNKVTIPAEMLNMKRNVICTEEQYEDIEEKDPNTIYFIIPS